MQTPKVGDKIVMFDQGGRRHCRFLKVVSVGKKMFTLQQVDTMRFVMEHSPSYTSTNVRPVWEIDVDAPFRRGFTTTHYRMFNEDENFIHQYFD